jgi:hypothetical protein
MQSRDAPVQHPPPTPTQDEADAFKAQAHGEAEADPAAPPAVVDVPIISGTGDVGSTLTCTMGNWTGEPTSYAYAWSSNGTAGPQQPSNTYAVKPADAGKSISCVVTATNDYGSTAAPPSNAIAVADQRKE